MNTNKKILSLLIPAYEYAFGVKRILDRLQESNIYVIKENIEIIISDDSKSDKVKDIVNKHSLKHLLDIKYSKRYSSDNNAASNWNSLLDTAESEYILFMHHDEFPYETNFFNSLIDKISKNNSIDIFFLRCNVLLAKNLYRPHLPLILKKIYFLSAEGIFLRNTVGSPSCAVIKRHKCPKFDERFKWIVDLDWYYRLLKTKSIKYKFINLNYISVRRDESISNKMKSNVSDINIKERNILKSDCEAIFIDTLSSSKSFVYKIILILEFLFWYSMRIVFFPLTLLSSLHVDKKLNKYIKNDC